jgi:hypothetical protein
MNKDTATSVEDFDKLAELHDMAAQAVELLKAMANEWRLMSCSRCSALVSQRCRNTSRSFAAKK